MESAVSFIGARELFTLAAVSARWRVIHDITRAMATFHSAIRDDVTLLSILPASLTARSIPRSGCLSVRRTKFRKLGSRCMLYFAYARMQWVAEWIADCVHVFKKPHIRDIIMRFAQFARADSPFPPENRVGFDYDFSLALDTSIAMIIAGHGNAHHFAIINSYDGTRSRWLINDMFARELAAQPVPCATFTEWIERVTEHDYKGAYAIFPFCTAVAKYIVHNVHSTLRILEAFRNPHMSPNIMIGPIAAQKITINAHNHVIARQFAYDSPEFGKYAEMLDRHTRLRKDELKMVRRERPDIKMTRASVCAHLVASAKNPDPRVFDYVLGKMREIEVLRDAYEMAWNYGEGFAVLQRATLRLENAGLTVTFERMMMSPRTRFDLLGDDAIPCVDFILARGFDVRKWTYAGRATCNILCACIARFGEPMERVIRAHIGDRIDALW